MKTKTMKALGIVFLAVGIAGVVCAVFFWIFHYWAMENGYRSYYDDSLMVACAKLGMHFVACTNKRYFPKKDLVEVAQEIAAETGATITLTEDVEEATTDADVIYTDLWVSMGEPAVVWGERIDDLLPYQVNEKAFEKAKDTAIFMHCLPAYHDRNTRVGEEVYKKFGLSELEVTNEVFEGPRSVVFDEAENRMHSIKAIMKATLSD